MSKIRKISVAIILIILIIGLLEYGRNIEVMEELSPFEQEYGEYKPKLWVVEDETSENKIYLFGSIHMGVKEMYPLPSTVVNAVNESEVLAVENDIIELEQNIDYLLELYEYLTYTDGTRLKDHITEEQMNKFQSVLNKYYMPVTESRYKPIYYSLVITQLIIRDGKYDAEYGVDKYLLSEAKEKGMEVKEIEDAQNTYKLLGGLSDETQSLIVESIIKESENEEELSKQLDILFKSWVNGAVDLAEEDLMEGEYEEYSEEYNNALFYVRNEIMVNKVIEYLKTDKIHFFMVGAGHYEGEKGIINILQEKGYSVRRIEY